MVHKFTRAIVALFASIVLSFIAATAGVHVYMDTVDGPAIEVTDLASRRIEQLNEAAAHASALEDAPAEEARVGLVRALDAYLALEPDRQDIQRYRADLDGDLASAVAAARLLEPSLRENIRANATLAAETAREIQQSRSQTSNLALAVDLGCTLLAIGAALAIRRLMNHHAELMEAERLFQADRASELEDFAGRIAHDIRSPLGTVSFALSLAGGQLEPDRRRAVIERGTAAIKRITTLVDGLLEFARAGGRPTQRARADVDTTIADIFGELAPVAASARATLSTTSDRRHAVACSPGVLTSLVANLARNAIKYLGDSAVRDVRIVVRGSGSVVRVEVVDTGPGLSPELAPRVFEPYFRAPNAAQGGVGLGLATVKRLAEAHGGRVGVESIPGAGATFWFELPKASGPAVSAPSSSDVAARLRERAVG